jgi:hypothetical protein
MTLVLDWLARQFQMPLGGFTRYLFNARKKGQHTRHVQGVVNLYAALLVAHDSRALQHGKMLGDRRDIGADELGEISYATALFCEFIHDEQASGMRQGLKNVGAKTQLVAVDGINSGVLPLLFGNIAK